MKLALKALEVQLWTEEPELARALAGFGSPWQPESVRRRERAVLALAICALVMLFGLMFSYLWGLPQ